MFDAWCMDVATDNCDTTHQTFAMPQKEFNINYSIPVLVNLSDQFQYLAKDVLGQIY